ncbi:MULTISPECIES: hypothetical protein [unclassified Streptomyces]|uniref:hypothetical protein n=1 Tax=unclassified Streptomyces TaxID=2593676 RepID=UPI0033A32448
MERVVEHEAGGRTPRVTPPRLRGEHDDVLGGAHLMVGDESARFEITPPPGRART